MKLTRRNFVKCCLASATLTAAGIFNAVEAAPLTSHFPSHSPLGEPRGIFPGRVVWTHSPSSVSWDGVDYWWKPENYNPAAIDAMLNTGLTTLTGQANPEEAWQKLFTWRNEQNGKSGGYAKGQKLVIKTNMNGAGEYNDDPHGRLPSPYGNPALLKCLLQSLVKIGHVAPDDITIFDTCRIYPDYMRAMCSEGELAGVKFKFRDPEGPMDALADTNARLNWSGPIQGEATYWPLCLTEATYMINLANLKGHSWGLTLTAKNHFGSFVNSDRRRTPAAAGLHPNIIDAKMGDYSVLVDIMADPQIRDKTMLWMVDALITAPSETGAISPANAKWDMPPFNGEYAASLFFSLDPIAIDSVGADFLVNEPRMKHYNSGLGRNHGMENYLHEAAILPNPPSGVKYRHGQASLGVHEHWNNAFDKKYSGNATPGRGIELLYKKM